MARPSHPSRETSIGPSVEGPWFSVHRVVYTSAYRRAPHSHPTLDVSLVLAGGFGETVGRCDEQATAMSVVVKPPGTVHANFASPVGASTVSVSIDPDAVELAEAGDPGEWRWIHGGTGLRPLVRLARLLADGDAPDLGDEVIDLLGEVTGGGSPPPGDVPAWLARAREAVEDGDAVADRVGDLAAHVGVHPVSLSRAFRRAFGVPVTVHRRRARLRRAAAALADGGHDLSRVAHHAGYSDHPHLCREVRRATGVTPSDLRELGKA